MDHIEKRDALRHAVLHAVSSRKNPFTLVSLNVSFREIGDALHHLTWHGYVTEYLEHPDGSDRQLGPAQGTLFCSWHGRDHAG